MLQVKGWMFSIRGQGSAASALYDQFPQFTSYFFVPKTIIIVIIIVIQALKHRITSSNTEGHIMANLHSTGLLRHNKRVATLGRAKASAFFLTEGTYLGKALLLVVMEGPRVSDRLRKSWVLCRVPLVHKS